MRPGQVDRLPGQHVDRLPVVGRQRIVRQVHVEVEVGDPGEPTAGIEIPHGRERGDPIRSRDRCVPETPAVLDRHAEPSHQGARVPAEALLPAWSTRWYTATGCPVTWPTSCWNGTHARKNSSSDPAMPRWNRSGSANRAASKAGHPTRRTSTMVEKRLSSSVTSRFASPG